MGGAQPAACRRPAPGAVSQPERGNRKNALRVPSTSPARGRTSDVFVPGFPDQSDFHSLVLAIAVLKEPGLGQECD